MRPTKTRKYMLQTEFSRIDHLIFGAPSLEEGIEWIAEKLAVRPTTGGQHIDFGTHNALFKIGGSTYFEIIAPDPALAHLGKKLWMGLEQLKGPALIWWAVKVDDISTGLEQAQKAGWDPGQPMDGSRKLPRGTLLSWQLSNPFLVQEQGVLPFLIDWGDSPHPTSSMPDVDCRLTGFRLLHPQPQMIRGYLSAIDLDFPVEEHPEPKIQAKFLTAKGSVYL